MKKKWLSATAIFKWNLKGLTNEGTGQILDRDQALFKATKNSFFIFLLIFLNLANAQATCKSFESGTELCSTVVLVSRKPRSYVYEIRRAKNNAPTVIEIPGGPGDGLIGDMDNIPGSSLVPDDFGIVAIDPRGVGKNNFGLDQDGMKYSTQAIVSDILQIIKSEGFTNYLIHGQSYGTVVATELGAELSKQNNIPKPKGIVLSGVLSKVIADPTKSYSEQLQRITSQLSLEQQALLRTNLKSILAENFKNNRKAFVEAIFGGLVLTAESDIGFGSNSPNFKKFIEMLASEKIDQSNAVYSAIQFEASNVPAVILPRTIMKRSGTMSEEIHCTELGTYSEDADVNFDFDKFSFSIRGSDCQAKGYKLVHPYNSKNFQIFNIPIYYFQGDLDPATPEASAFEHFQAQLNAPKLFVEIKGLAHLSLIGLKKCENGLWESLLAGPASTASLLNRCSDPNIKVLDPLLRTNLTSVLISR